VTRDGSRRDRLAAGWQSAERVALVTSTLMNADFLAGLPDDVRRTVEMTVDELGAWSFDVQADMNAVAIAAMRDSDIEVVELTEDERETFREMSRVDEVERAERGRQ